MNSEKVKISHSLAYALSSNIYPLFHDDDEIKMFSDYFEVSKESIHEIVDFIDKAWLKKEFYSYYNLEDMFGGKVARHILIAILRYCFLDNRFFDEEFTKVLLSSCPVEATNIAEPLEEWEI